MLLMYAEQPASPDTETMQAGLHRRRKEVEQWYERKGIRAQKVQGACPSNNAIAALSSKTWYIMLLLLRGKVANSRPGKDASNGYDVQTACYEIAVMVSRYYQRAYSRTGIVVYVGVLS